MSCMYLLILGIWYNRLEDGIWATSPIQYYQKKKKIAHGFLFLDKEGKERREARGKEEGS